MATEQEVRDELAAVTAKTDAVLAAVDAAKTALTAEIARVEALITAGGATGPQLLTDVLTGLQGVAAKLDTATTDATATKTEADAERP